MTTRCTSIIRELWWFLVLVGPELCSCGLRLLLVVLKKEGQHRRNYNLSFEVEASLGLDMIDAFLWHAKTKRQRLANVIG